MKIVDYMLTCVNYLCISVMCVKAKLLEFIRTIQQIPLKTWIKFVFLIVLLSSTSIFYYRTEDNAKVAIVITVFNGTESIVMFLTFVQNQGIVGASKFNSCR